MVDGKPLPALPTGSTLVALSVEARDHRAALIGHLLKDLHEPDIDSRRDHWLSVFEAVLDDLGKHVKSADWLNAIRRGREFKRSAGLTTNATACDGPTLSQPSDAVIAGKSQGNENREDTSSLDPLRSFQQLRVLAAAPPSPPGQAQVSHLLLCLESHTSHHASTPEDHRFSLAPANVGCTFSVGKFLLPDANKQDEADYILSGLDGLGVDMWGSPLRLVGGTFTFKGLDSPLQYQLLSKILKLSIYIHFSLILEQNILSDSAVNLTMPPSKGPRALPSTPTKLQPSEGIRFLPKSSIFPSKFIDFLSRHNLRYHGTETVGEVGSRGPLDLVSHVATEVPMHRVSSETPHEGHLAGRFRRLSLIGEKRLTFLKGHHRELSRERKSSTRSHLFANALRRVEDSRKFFSTSLGVEIPLPKIMTDLREKEAMDPKPVQTLRADEKVALMTLLGWDGKEEEGRGMSGINGFLRQQQISVLVSHHPVMSTQRTPSVFSGSGSSDIQSPSKFSQAGETFSSIVASSHFQGKLPPCGKPNWVTYRYYSSDSGEDYLLGDWVVDIAKKRQNRCSAKSGCGLTEEQHEKRIIHDRVKIAIRLADSATAGDGEKHETAPVDKIFVWESCAICAAKTSQKLMTTGSFLFSYAKYLELLAYSPLFCRLSPSLCEHTTPLPAPSSLPTSRFNIVRHFTTSSTDISFSLSPLEEVFEVQIPRLQIIKGVDMAPSPFTKAELVADLDGDLSLERTELRRQIKKWWEGVSDHLDKIEQALSIDSGALLKALPRLPSDDEAYEVFATIQENGTQRGLSAPIPFTSVPLSVSDGPDSNMVPNSSDPQTSKPAIILSQNDSERLLVSLRQNFQRTERSLYSHLARTDTALNEIRRAFLFAGRGAQKRLQAWQDKHLDGAKSKVVGDLVAVEPEWWGKGCHVVPNGNIIVRENDWGSIIAHTLNTADYQVEMTQLSSTRSGLHQSQTTSSSYVPSTSSTFFSLNSGYRLFTSSKNLPDPDEEGIVWNEPESYSANISRKDHGRDASGLPSIRGVLGRKVTPSQQIADGISTSTLQGDFATVAKANGIEMADKSEEVTPTLSRQVEPRPAVINSVIEEEKRSSTMSDHSGSDKSTKEKEPAGQGMPVLDVDTPPPPLPTKDGAAIGRESAVSATVAQSIPRVGTSSGFTTGLTTGINTAMKYITGAESPSRFLAHGLSNVRKSSSRFVDASINDRPHIKYDWTMGKRVKFSCTVYYAKQFEILRKKCGVHDIFVTSLSRSENWIAEGGKSRSNFWKTSDDKFIIKTLVNAWNVADLQVLIDHAPSYFRYMDATASKPTVLAKLLGFYTVEIKNLETGVSQAKTDLLVMENLFHGRNISKKFDLKGIQGRKVKSPGTGSKMLFDGEWIEGQQKTLTLVRPSSKTLLQDAIRRDADFLSKSNIMDYSLLLGVDEDKKEIACGLVDTIGSYTFAKTLEYKAKQGLQTGKEVTVMPPAEYQDRFVKTLDGYFIACPDKWSKPLDGSKFLNDPNCLPSVL